MSGEFDDVFGSGSRPGFTERVARPDGHATQEAAEASAGSGPYKPYGYLPAGGLAECCDVQRWRPSSTVAEGIEFQYRFLMQVGYVGDEELRLFLPDCIVVIEGKNLRDLRKKLARRQVTFIQQFSGSVWPSLPPADEAVIERIEVARSESFGSRGGTG